MVATPAFSNGLLFQPGTEFGAYRIERLLGAGGMGQVYEAVQVALGKRVAIKVILPEHAANPEVVARFLREAQATARIRHPNVVDVTDVGSVNGIPFLAMEFLDGEPLSARITRDKMLDASDAVDLVVPVLAALQAAHELGMVHRDIKPDNIFLVDERGGVRPTLVDFGITKLLDGGAAGGLTKTALVVGTPYYMAPEQAEDSKRVDARADLYSLGVVLYESLVGVVPFGGDSLVSILLHIAKGEYTPLRERRPGLDEKLAAAVQRAMASEARKRFSTASDFAHGLMPFASPEIRARYGREFQAVEFTWTDSTDRADSEAKVDGKAPHGSATPHAAVAANDTVRTDKKRISRPFFALLAAAAVGAVSAFVALSRQQPEAASKPSAAAAKVETAAPPVAIGAPPPAAPSPEVSPSSVPAAATPEAPPTEAPSAHVDVRPNLAKSAALREFASATIASVAKPVVAAASLPPPGTSGLRANITFSGDCHVQLGADARVMANEQAVTIFSMSGGVSNTLTIGACKPGAAGALTLGTTETAQRGVMVSVTHNARAWMTMPNVAQTDGPYHTSGQIIVQSHNCNTGAIDVTFRDATLINTDGSSRCVLNGTLRTVSAE